MPRRNQTADAALKAALLDYLKSFLDLAEDSPAAIAVAEHAFLCDAEAADQEQYLYAKSTLLGLQAAEDAAVPPTTRTEWIEGLQVTLIPGRTYFATRPMAKSGMRQFPVTVADATGQPVYVTPPLTYESANRFMTRFASTIPFGGIVW